MGGWSVNRKQHSQNRKSAKSARGEAENKKRLERLSVLAAQKKRGTDNLAGLVTDDA